VSKTKSPARARKSARLSSRPAKRKRASSTRGKRVQLKPLYLQLGRTIDQLMKLPQSDRVRFAIERLQQHRSEFERICGPTMDIPAEPNPPSV
jgi:hypothetical protein